MTELPGLMPKDGDLSKDSAGMTEDDFVNVVVMGGVNGYAISSYTKYKDACIEFVNYATGYDMVSRRTEMLGIAPAREDVAKQTGGMTDMIFKSLSEGKYILCLPSKLLTRYGFLHRLCWEKWQRMLSINQREPKNMLQRRISKKHWKQ